MSRYHDTYRAGLEDPERFWAQAAEALDWYRKPTRILDDSRPPFHRWFPDGELNTCHNALDRHVEAGKGESTALVYDSPVTGTVARWTYRELRDETAEFAGALVNCGVTRGDRVVLYMPMIPQAAIAMLACARIGAVHSVVFGGFAPRELAVRIDDAAPKVVVSASCGVEGARTIAYKPLLDEALALAEHTPDRCIVLQRSRLPAELGPRDLDWADAVAAAEPADCVPVAAGDPLYVLYTSGTTGRPKGVVRDNGGHAVALRWSMENLYDVHPGETLFTASDVGWVVGHSYIVYAPLLTGATTVLYEGKPVGTPDAGQFWRVVEEHRVKALFTAPTAIRAIRKQDPDAAYAAGRDLGSLACLFLAGERLDPGTLNWAQEKLGVPVIDHWWQTETGWAVAGNLMGLDPMEVKPGSPTVPVPGWDVRVVDAGGQRVPPGTDGLLAVRLPLPPGALTTLWGDDDRFVSSYFSAVEGHYVTGDSGHFDEDGYLFVMGRTDDVINVAGHRLSTGSMEEALASHPDVAECAVIGVEDALKGQVPRGFVVLREGAATGEAEVVRELVARVRERIGAVAALKEVSVVAALPKTRSGKILRKSMRALAAGEDAAVPSTIEDPAVLEELRPVLRRRG